MRYDNPDCTRSLLGNLSKGKEIWGPYYLVEVGLGHEAWQYKLRNTVLLGNRTQELSTNGIQNGSVRASVLVHLLYE